MRLRGWWSEVSRREGRRQGAFLRMAAALPDAPNIGETTLESKLLAKLDLPNVFRPAPRPGLAFIGDAALAADPRWGVGCGWAFQSADWLVRETTGALIEDADLDQALERYRRAHRGRLLAHYLLITEIASGRPISPFERRLYRTAAHDRVVRATFESIGSRRRSPLRLLDPRVLACLALARAPARPVASVSRGAEAQPLATSSA